MLYVIGDSHTVAWSGQEFCNARNKAPVIAYESVPVNYAETPYSNIRPYHMGSLMAYHLLTDDNEIGRDGQLFNWFFEQTPDISAVVISIGEIDIREQVVKRLKVESIPMQQSAERIGKRIIDYCRIVREKYTFPIFLSGIIGTGLDEALETHPAMFGTITERNLANLYLDNYMRTESHSLQSVYYMSVINEFITSNLKTKPQYYSRDHVHLNQAGFQIVKRKFIEVCQENNLPNYFE